MRMGRVVIVDDKQILSLLSLPGWVCVVLVLVLVVVSSVSAQGPRWSKQFESASK